MAVGTLRLAAYSSSNSVVLLLLMLAFYQVADCQTNKFLIKDSGKVSKASQLIIAHAPDYVTFLPNAGAVPSDEISTIVALALGFSSPKEMTWSGLLAGNLFRRPKANVLITIDGVTNGDKFNVPGKLVSYPVDQAEDGATVTDILAMSDSKAENLPRYVSDSFQGKSLTVSLSADEKEALAGFSRGTNSHMFYWNSKKESFSHLENAQDGRFNEMVATKEKVLKRLETADFGKAVKYSKDAGVFTIAVPGKGKAIFDMSKKEDFSLFAEVDAVFELLKQLAKDPTLVNDGTPDIFTITISALKAIRHRYGETSLQAQGAATLLKSILPKITSQFAELYHGSAVVEVLSLEWQGNLSDKYPEALEQVYKHLQPHLQSQSLEMFQHDLPGVNLKDNLGELVKDSLCGSLQSKLLTLQPNLKVTCLGSHHRARRDAKLSDQSKKALGFDLTTLALIYDGNFPVIFNVWLWLIIGLVLSLYVICLVLWNMDPGRDSIIYRMTSQRIKTE